jgi:hypothetical protein
MPRDLARLFARRNVRDLKIDLWNDFVDSGMLEILEEDCSALPRILPASYLPTITAAARDVTEFFMKFLSLPTDRIRKLVPPTPVTRYLIQYLDVLKHRRRRIVGSLRYDFALVGPPVRGNPPKLMEVNEIGFDGTGRSSHIQATLLRLFPEIRRRVRALDTAASEVRNMLRVGKRLLRLHYDSYNWEEEVICAKAKRLGLEIDMVSPALFGLEIEEDYPLLRQASVRMRRNRMIASGSKTFPHAIQLAYSFNLPDYKEGRELFRTIIRSKTTQYNPFITGLVAPKTSLLLIGDRDLRQELLGKRRAERVRPVIVPAGLLSDCLDDVKRNFHRRVIKHADGMAGDQVHVGREIPAQLRRIPKRRRSEWLVQERIFPNTLDVDGFMSRPRRVMADLGVYVHFDWNGRQFSSFRVGGFVTRASSRSLKVNMTAGTGIVVPILFDRSR